MFDFSIEMAHKVIRFKYDGDQIEYDPLASDEFPLFVCKEPKQEDLLLNIEYGKVVDVTGKKELFSVDDSWALSKANEGMVLEYKDRNLEGRVERMALFNEETSAKRTFNDVSYNIAKLLFERIVTIYSGWHHFFDFVNSNRADLSENHSYRSTLLDNIIIGQRLGDLLEESRGKDVFFEPCMEFLTKFIVESPYLDAKFKNHYLKDEKFNEDLILTSKLREAPAIGAGVDAYLTYQGD
jgi:hypothetical protein